MFDGFSWTVAARAAAFWSLSADWPMTCVPPLPHAGAAGLGLVSRLLRPVQVPAVAFGRRVVRLRDGAAVAGAEDPDRDVGVRRLLLHRRCERSGVLVGLGRLADDLQSPPPAWAWSAVCSVTLRFPADASDDASFDCDTGPSSPGLRTRIADVGVRRLLLHRRCQRSGVLVRVGRLADDLIAVALAAGLATGLILVGSLLAWRSGCRPPRPTTRRSTA